VGILCPLRSARLVVHRHGDYFIMSQAALSVILFEQFPRRTFKNPSSHFVPRTATPFTGAAFFLYIIRCQQVVLSGPLWCAALFSNEPFLCVG